MGTQREGTTTGSSTKDQGDAGQVIHRRLIKAGSNISCTIS